MSQSPCDSLSDRTGTVEFTESDRHRLLAAERRRVALDILTKRTTPVELEELAAAIAARETDVEAPPSEDGETPPSDAVDRVTVPLHHQHLPILTEAGAIDYDPASRRIEFVFVTAELL